MAVVVIAGQRRLQMLVHRDRVDQKLQPVAVAGHFLAHAGRVEIRRPAAPAVGLPVDDVVAPVVAEEQVEKAGQVPAGDGPVPVGHGVRETPVAILARDGRLERRRPPIRQRREVEFPFRDTVGVGNHPERESAACAILGGQHAVEDAANHAERRLAAPFGFVGFREEAVGVELLGDDLAERPIADVEGDFLEDLVPARARLGSGGKGEDAVGRGVVRSRCGILRPGLAVAVPRGIGRQRDGSRAPALGVRHQRGEAAVAAGAIHLRHFRQSVHRERRRLEGSAFEPGPPVDHRHGGGLARHGGECGIGLFGGLDRVPEQASQRRVGADELFGVEREEDGAVDGPRQGDVDVAQMLDADLGLLGRIAGGRVGRDVERAGDGVVVFVEAASALGFEHVERRREDDGEFEALAGEDGHDPHGVVVGLHPQHIVIAEGVGRHHVLDPGERGLGRLAFFRDLALDPFDEVRDVGEAAEPVRKHRQARPQPERLGRLREHRREPAAPPRLAPGFEENDPVLDRSRCVLRRGERPRFADVEGDDVRGGQSDPRREQDAAQRTAVPRLEHGLEQQPEEVRLLGFPDAARSLADAGDAQMAQFVRDPFRLQVGVHEHGDLPGAHGGAGDAHRGVAEDFGDAGRHDPVGLLCRLRRSAGNGAAFRQIRNKPELERLVVGRSADGQRLGGFLAMRLQRLVVGDRRMSESALRAIAGTVHEDLVDGGDEPRLRAVVRVELVARLGRDAARRVHIRLDVAVAKAIDGLLGVADQEARHVGAVAEEVAEDAPLDRVRVLELVDERRVELRAKRRVQRALGAVFAKRLAQVEQVVVEGDAARRSPPRPVVARDGLGRLGEGPGVVEHRVGLGDEAFREEHELRQAEAGLRGAGRDDVRPPPVAAALDDFGIGGLAGLGVEGLTGFKGEAAEHALAEAVDRVDGREVEVQQRLGQAGHRHLAVDRLRLRQRGHLDDSFIGVRRRVVLEIERFAQHLLQALLQLLRGGLGERDDEDLLDRQPFDHDQPQVERLDAVRLARARAGGDEVHARHREVRRDDLLREIHAAPPSPPAWASRSGVQNVVATRSKSGWAIGPASPQTALR